MIRTFRFSMPALFALVGLAGCGAAPEPEGAPQTEATDTQAAPLVTTPHCSVGFHLCYSSPDDWSCVRIGKPCE